MNRRKFLSSAATVAGAHLSSRALGKIIVAPEDGTASTIVIEVDPSKEIGVISPKFMGLGYEISSVADGGPLSGGSRVYQQLVRTLGNNGVIRVGGNTSDYSSFSASGKSVSKPKGTVINQKNLRALGEFLKDTGWSLIWGLNLGGGSEQDAIAEAQAVTEIAGDRLIAFEIGNEPDLFLHEGHRQVSYSYDNYLGEYRRFKKAVRASLPQAPFAGPDAAIDMDWVTRFAADEGHDLKLLTCHYYREGQNPSSTLAKLLHPDPGLQKRLESARAAGASANLGYRICETNSFSGGGRPGVSDTFGAALWVLDFMFTLAAHQAEGVNIETGINQLDFVSSYSPLRGDASSGYSAAPEYYGMLAFAQAAPGRIVQTGFDAAGAELSTYSVKRSDGTLAVVIINKDVTRNVTADLHAGPDHQKAHVLRLQAPNLESKDEVTLGGASVDSNGSWKERSREPIASRGGRYAVNVPAGSAAIVFLSH